MIDPLQSSVRVASAGLEAQSLRLRVVSENLANAGTTGATPGSDPYQRKTVVFGSELDRATGATLTKVKEIAADQSAFRIEHDPGNPAADQNGNVKLSNVDTLIEVADLREANRSYEANLQVIKQARDLFSMTLDLMKG